MTFYDQVGKFPLESSRFNNVVVNPVVVASSRFAHDHTVVAEIMLF